MRLCSRPLPAEKVMQFRGERQVDRDLDLAALDPVDIFAKFRNDRCITLHHGEADLGKSHELNGLNILSDTPIDSRAGRTTTGVHTYAFHELGNADKKSNKIGQ